MTESEFLSRIDRHLERAEAREVRDKTLMAETQEVIRDHRLFIREITTRQERVTQQLVEEIAANTRRIDAGTRELEDLTLRSEQHTQALARMLDRLD